MSDQTWRTEPVWLGDGVPPDGAIIYKWPGGNAALRASSRCPADVAITELWQARYLAQLARMEAGDDGWPGTQPKKMRRKKGR